MADLKLTSEHDLDLSTGDLQLVTGDQAIAQELGIRFRFFKGEWFINREEGVPYLQKIMKKNVPMYVITSIFRQVLSTTPGVAEILELEFDANAEERILEISSFKVRTTTGEILDVLTYDEPFVIDVS